VLTLAASGCSRPSSPPGSSEHAATSVAPPETPEGRTGSEAASPYDALPGETRALLDLPFKGDFDEMVKRRLIRAAVVFNRTQYFIDHGVQRGISYEALKSFEEYINKKEKTKTLKVHIAIVPLPRDQIFSALEAGKVDLVAAALTITPERRKVADFTNPTRTGVSEVPVTTSDVPPLASPDDLSGREVFVRPSSSYNESLRRLNESLVARGKSPVVIKDAPEALEDDDLLEMVNAGLVQITIVDSFVAELWKQVFDKVRVHDAAAVRTNGEIAVAVRKNNPKLRSVGDEWIKMYGPRTAFGNTMDRRYLQDTKYVKDATSEKERQKFLELVQIFDKYGKEYNVDYLLMAAQGYQESRLDQSVKSRVGAVGVMQLMPATGKELAVGDITKLEPNVHAGVKYFRFMMDEFYKDEPMDNVNKGLMTLASYNAGPARMRQMRAEAAKRGLNPNVWFGNVERVVSERVGRETVDYVSNIYKYYVAYRLVMDRRDAREQAKQAIKTQ
jgi:membrane-bound lytic murein transglycosylase MltF